MNNNYRDQSDDLLSESYSTPNAGSTTQQPPPPPPPQQPTQQPSQPPPQQYQHHPILPTYYVQFNPPNPIPLHQHNQNTVTQQQQQQQQTTLQELAVNQNQQYYQLQSPSQHFSQQPRHQHQQNEELKKLKQEVKGLKEKLGINVEGQNIKCSFGPSGLRTVDPEVMNIALLANSKPEFLQTIKDRADPSEQSKILYDLIRQMSEGERMNPPPRKAKHTGRKRMDRPTKKAKHTRERTKLSNLLSEQARLMSQQQQQQQQIQEEEEEQQQQQQQQRKQQEEEE